MKSTIGPGGRWQVTADEQFVKTNAGCYSRLQPKVLTVDGQKTL